MEKLNNQAAAKPPFQVTDTAQSRRCRVCGSDDCRREAVRGDGLEIGRCAGCGIARLRLLPDEEALMELYNGNYFNGDGGIGYREYDLETGIRAQSAGVAAAIEEFKPEARSCLDVGCATGLLLDRLASQSGVDTYGVEPSSWAASTASAKGHTVLCDVWGERCWSELQFDVIVSLDVIEHVLDPNEFLRTILERLRPGGVAIIGTPNYGLFATLGDQYPGLYRSLEHLYYFDLLSLTALAQRSGYRVLRCETILTRDEIVTAVERNGALGARAKSLAGLLRRWSPLYRVYKKLRPLALWFLRVASPGIQEGETILAILKKPK